MSSLPFYHFFCLPQFAMRTAKTPWLADGNDNWSMIVILPLRRVCVHCTLLHYRTTFRYRDALFGGMRNDDTR